jgi:hypothetical protein
VPEELFPARKAIPDAEAGCRPDCSARNRVALLTVCRMRYFKEGKDALRDHMRRRTRTD